MKMVNVGRTISSISSLLVTKKMTEISIGVKKKLNLLLKGVDMIVVS